MANALSIFDNRPQLPAELQAELDAEANILPRQTVPSLSFAGKTWTINLNEQKIKLVRKDADGDDIPLSVFRGIVLGANARRGRAYYEGAYDPERVAMPLCWSDDGIAPSDRVQEPQAAACNKCPKSVKGSKIDARGKETVACTEHRLLAIIPAGKPDFQPLRLKIPVTSDWDNKSPDHVAQGWYAWSNYTQFLISKGVKHSAEVITKIKFDPNTDYPKLLFSADRMTDAETLAHLMPTIKSETVKQLVSGSWQPNDDTPSKAAPPAEEPVDEVAEARKRKAAAKAEPEEEPEDFELPGDPAPAKTPAPTTASPAKTPPVVKPTASIKPTVAAKPAAAKAAPTVAKKAKAEPKEPEEEPEASEESEAPAAPAGGADDINSLLSDWT